MIVANGCRPSVSAKPATLEAEDVVPVRFEIAQSARVLPSHGANLNA
jgi:hypothetical protein